MSTEQVLREALERSRSGLANLAGVGALKAHYKGAIAHELALMDAALALPASLPSSQAGLEDELGLLRLEAKADRDARAIVEQANAILRDEACAMRKALRQWTWAMDAGINTTSPIPGGWPLVDALTQTNKLKVFDGRDEAERSEIRAKKLRETLTVAPAPTESEPSPDVLKAADALAEHARQMVERGFTFRDRDRLQELEGAYRAARGPRPEHGELIRGAEKK